MAGSESGKRMGIAQIVNVSGMATVATCVLGGVLATAIALISDLDYSRYTPEN
jgi:hypothetical protein